jgi:superfamily II DNA or RNA helicase
MPKYRAKMWDGYIKLYSVFDSTLYVGLLPYLKLFCKNRNYSYDIDPLLEDKNSYTDEEIKSLTDELKLPFELRDYQLDAIKQSLNEKRRLILSPTASGKSAIIYSIIRLTKKRTLLIVPTISLVNQIYSDFQKYSENDSSFDAEKECHIIFQGKEKHTSKNVVITTWQSIYKMPKSYFQDFHLVLGDEVHLFKSDSLKKILHNLVNTEYRIGTTGTLDGTKTHRLVLEGLFGSVYQTITTKSLMDRKQLADLKIRCLVLKYSDEICKLARNLKYQDELKFLLRNKQRLIFTRNLILNTTENTLVLFQIIEHGKALKKIVEDKLTQENSDRKVFFVYGDTEAKVREDIRHIVEKEKDAIIIASSGTFSTGVNITNIQNVIFTSPTKARIKTLQSIGRGLRISATSDTVTLYDIADDMSYKSSKNFSLKHFFERLKIYDEEKFTYKIIDIDLSDK